MFVVPAEKAYWSIGPLAQRLQVPFPLLEQTAAALGITPALRINGVATFDGNQVQQIARVLALFDIQDKESTDVHS